MAKQVHSLQRDKAGKCIFCGEPGLSRTHVWPKWLHNLLTKRDVHRIESSSTPRHRPSAGITGRMKQGSIFNVKPRLACIVCNTGWMKGFEDDVETFAKPLFSSHAPVVLDEQQVRALARWIALLAILAEHLDRESLIVSKSEMEHVRLHREPPPQWSIFSASLDGDVWRANYAHLTKFVGQFSSREEYERAVNEYWPRNSKLTSFGIGSVFFQIFSCPDTRFISDYRLTSEKAGLIPLWPPAPARLWPYRKEGTAQYPTQLVLNDAAAEYLSNAYSERISRLADFHT